jgi:hypothetical protein
MKRKHQVYMAFGLLILSVLMGVEMCIMLYECVIRMFRKPAQAKIYNFNTIVRGEHV